MNVAINCAGIGIAVRTLSKKGAHPLDQFQKVLNVGVTRTWELLFVRTELVRKGEHCWIVQCHQTRGRGDGE